MHSPHGIKAPPHLLLLFAIALVGLVAYSNSLNATFHFDDYGNIVKNRAINEPAMIANPMAHKSIGLPIDIRRLLATRPLGYLSFSFNYMLGGLAVQGYHIVNLLIHISAACALYWLVILMFQSHHLRDLPMAAHARWAALLAALLFISHPIQTQAVTYIVQRFTSMSALFYLLAVALYARFHTAGGWKWYALSLASATCAMLTKEIAFTLPVMLTLYDIFFVKNKKHSVWLLTPHYLIALLIPLNLLWFHGSIAHSLESATRDDVDMSRFQYMVTQARVTITYLRLLVLPINQNLDYDYMSYGSTLKSLAALSALFMASISALFARFYLKRRRELPWLRLVAFGWAWFFLALAVESTLIPIKDVINEHRAYLPSAGVFMAAAGAFVAYCSSLDRARIKLMIGFALAIIVLFTAASWSRNRIWKDDMTLWSDVVRKSPNKIRPYLSLAASYSGIGNHANAIEMYERALARGLGDEAFIHHNLAMSYLSYGDDRRGLEHLIIAAELTPQDLEAHLILTNMLIKKGRAREALVQFSDALDIIKTEEDPKLRASLMQLAQAYIGNDKKGSNMAGLLFTESHDRDAMDNEAAEGIIVANLYLSEGEMDRAADALHWAIEHKPLPAGLVEASERMELAFTYIAEGRVLQAISTLKSLTKDIPEFELGHFHLANLLAQQGDLAGAIESYKATLALMPEKQEALNNLASIYMMQDKFADAAPLFERALKKSPNDPDIHYNLAAAYENIGNMDSALGEYKKALTLNPEDQEAATKIHDLSDKLGSQQEQLHSVEQ